MAEVTVTFDPERVMMLTDVARAADCDQSTLRQWIKRRTGKGNIPEPLFTLPVRGNNSLAVYSQEQGLQLAQLYRNFRFTRSRMSP